MGPNKTEHGSAFLEKVMTFWTSCSALRYGKPAVRNSDHTEKGGVSPPRNSIHFKNRGDGEAQSCGTKQPLWSSIILMILTKLLDYSTAIYSSNILHRFYPMIYLDSILFHFLFIFSLVRKIYSIIYKCIYLKKKNTLTAAASLHVV